MQREYEAQQAYVIHLTNDRVHELAFKFESNRNANPYMRGDVVEIMHANSLFSDLQDDLATSRPYNKNMDKLNKMIRELESNPVASKNKVAAKAKSLVARVADDEKKIDDLKNKLNPNWVARFLSNISPFFIAIAIAIRIAKVNTELIMLQKDKKRDKKRGHSTL